MKRLDLAVLFVLMGLATSRLASAQYAAGLYRFTLDDDLVKSVDFEAWVDQRGLVAGQLTFTDQAWISDYDAEDPRPGDSPPELYVKATFDSMTVEKNQAVLNGTVVDSSHGSYFGRWVQLVIEDNGKGPEIPDRLTWMFCQPPPGTWIPSDAELEHDDGAYLSWWATDAERRDDVGIPSPNLLARVTSCPALPPWLYPFADLRQWEGDLVVQP